MTNMRSQERIKFMRGMDENMRTWKVLNMFNSAKPEHE
jgi:hypothetical protein